VFISCIYWLFRHLLWLAVLRLPTSAASEVEITSTTTLIARTAPSNSDHRPEARGRAQQPSSLSNGFDATTSSEDSSTNTEVPRDDGRIEFSAPTGL
jgi:hypothetical protein